MIVWNISFIQNESCRIHRLIFALVHKAHEGMRVLWAHQLFTSTTLKNNTNQNRSHISDIKTGTRSWCQCVDLLKIQERIIWKTRCTMTEEHTVHLSDTFSHSVKKQHPLDDTLQPKLTILSSFLHPVVMSNLYEDVNNQTFLKISSSDQRLINRFTTTRENKWWAFWLLVTLRSSWMVRIHIFLRDQ